MGRKTPMLFLFSDYCFLTLLIPNYWILIFKLIRKSWLLSLAHPMALDPIGQKFWQQSQDPVTHWYSIHLPKFVSNHFPPQLYSRSGLVSHIGHFGLVFLSHMSHFCQWPFPCLLAAFLSALYSDIDHGRVDGKSPEILNPIQSIHPSYLL